MPLSTTDLTTAPSPRPGRRSLLVVLLGALLAILGTAVPAAAVDVVGDDGLDLYAGTGGTVWPARDWRGDEAGRQEAAGCEGCAWRVTTACTRLDYDTGSCPGSHVGCPAGTVRVRVWLQRTGEPWRLVGTACIGDRPPLTRADLSVVGVAVTLDARVRWHWSWGDGSQAWTSDPGGRWPDAGVTHTYRRTGTVGAGVTSVWRGEYVVDGLGPFPVPGAPLTQDALLTVDVVEARALLVG